MVSFKTVTAICLGATLCLAQSINIQGVVQNNKDVGIEGATVKLEVAGIKTTTGKDGSFILKKDPVEIKQQCISRTVAATPIQLKNGKIVFTLSENALVAVSIYNLPESRYSQTRDYTVKVHIQ